MIDRRSIAGKAPRPDRHVPLVVVGAGAAGVAAAVEAARAGVEVLLVDEHPIDNDMMAMDVPLCFGQRMDATVRNRAAMLERVVETNPALASVHDAGVDVQLGTCVWGAFVNGPTVQELPAPMLGLADDRRSWLVGYDRLIVAAGARDVLLGFPGWERAGVVEVGARVRGHAATATALAERGVSFYTAHTIHEARGRTGEIESVVLVAVDGTGKPIRGGPKEIACDAVCWAIGLVPSVELLHLIGARLRFVSSLGGWVPEVDARMRTSVPTVFAAGDCAGFHDGRLATPDVAHAQGRWAGLAAAESLGARACSETQDEVPVASPAPDTGPHAYWQAWLDSLIAAGGWEVNVCQCEEVTRRELVETKPPRYLKWDSPQMNARRLATLLRDGPVNQDQIKRLTRAGMGPCQSRRCREQVGLLLAQAAGTTLDRIPLPTFRPPIRPLPLNVLWPADEPPAMREHWVSWFGIPTQFSPHWEAGMAIDEPTARARLIVSDE